MFLQLPTKKMTEERERPECFGLEERVMPRDEETGFIITQEDCTGCPHLKECLRTALDASVKRVRELDENRPPPGYDAIWNFQEQAEEEEEPGGLMGFIRRWSRLKKDSGKKD